MKRANGDGPGQQSRAYKRHVDRVPEDCFRGTIADDFKPVRANETLGRDELKGDLLPWLVGDDRVADWSVATGRAESKRLVQAHPRPVLRWP